MTINYSYAILVGESRHCAFIAPEVYHTHKFTQKSDIYSVGIIAYLLATGELPFRDREFDRYLVCDILGGLRPI